MEPSESKPRWDISHTRAFRDELADLVARYHRPGENSSDIIVELEAQAVFVRDARDDALGR